MKLVSCNFCGSDDSIECYLLKGWQTKKEGTFQLVQCQNCGLFYLNPQPSWKELEGYYPNEYLPYVIAPKEERESFLARAKRSGWVRRANVIRTNINKGRLAGVGSSPVYFAWKAE